MSPATTPSHRVLGVDPGLARMGWAIVEISGRSPELIGCGCVETPAGQRTEKRLQTLHQRLGQIILDYKPESMAVEKLYFTSNVTTAMTVSQARGIVLLAAAEGNIELQEFTPTAVKQSVTGDGRADKRQMGKMIQLLLKLKQLPKHDDTADAIAIALCGSSQKVVH